MSEESHLPPHLAALVREADAVMTASDEEVIAKAKSYGYDKCVERAQAWMAASDELFALSKQEEEGERTFADAWLGKHCVDAAERLLDASMMPAQRPPPEPFFQRLWRSMFG